MSYLSKSLTDIHNAILNKEVSPLDLVKEALELDGVSADFKAALTSWIEGKENAEKSEELKKEIQNSQGLDVCIPYVT